MATETKVEIIEIDEEELVGFDSPNTENLTVEDDIEATKKTVNDPRLVQTPIVYTTRLDDMAAVNINSSNMNVNKVTNTILSESKPKYSQQSINPKKHDSANSMSYNKVSYFVEQMNVQVESDAHRTLRNMDLWNQCKPLSIILIDCRKNTQSTSDITASKETPKTCDEPKVPYNNNNKEYSFKVLPDNEIHEGQAKMETISNEKTASSGSALVPAQETLNTQSPTDNTFNTLMKIIQPQDTSTEKVLETSISTASHHTDPLNEIESSRKITKSKENRAPTLTGNSESSEEDEVPIVQFKSKYVRNKSIPSVLKQIYPERFALIVLMRIKGEEKNEVFIYRLNSTKLITNFYITTDYNEYKLAGMYPKEEKILEQYCCWNKREDIITNLCRRKNYPYTVLKFMTMPHNCPPEDCQCCCYNAAVAKKKEPKSNRKDLELKSLHIADSWIRGLMEKNQRHIGLVAKAISYIPKSQTVVHPSAKDSENYINSVLLTIKYKGSSSSFKYTTEMYEIGTNGDVINSFQLSDGDGEQVKQTYHELKIDIAEDYYCCWYSREKIMTDLRCGRASPTALKSMQMSHPCERRTCTCCCKPRRYDWSAIEPLPSTLQYTTSYEKNYQPLAIHFNSKVLCNRPSTHTVPKSTPITGSRSVTKKNVEKDLPATSAVLEIQCNNGKQDCSGNQKKLLKNLKLGVTSDGKAAAILDTPAKKLSILELNVLSKVLALKAKEATKPRPAIKEFCNTIANNKSNPPNTKKLTPDSQRNLTKDFPSQIHQAIPVNIEHPQTIEKQDLPKQCRLTPISDPNKLHTAKLALSKSVYTSLTMIMEKKNQSYVDSFKMYFQNKVLSKTPMSDVASFGSTTTNQSGMPKIGLTFTLKNFAVDNAVAGPSGFRRQPCKTYSRKYTKNLNSPTQKTLGSFSNSIQIEQSKTNESQHNQRSKRQINSDSNPVKKLRVKSPSKLLAADATSPVLPPINTAQEPVAMWPLPITIKREPQLGFQTIQTPQQPLALQINPNLQTGAFLIANNVVTAPNIKILNTNTNLYQVNGNRIVTSTAITNPNFAGSNIFTLTPLPTTSNVTNVGPNKTMLAHILTATPQTYGLNSTTGDIEVPSLVPIGSRVSVPKVMSSADQSSSGASWPSTSDSNKL